MKLKNKFPYFKKNKKDIYLDSAASSLKLDDAINENKSYLEKYGVNIDRGMYKSAISATNLYEDARLETAKFINANKSEIIFTSGTTDSLNILANSIAPSLEKDDEILTTIAEHNSAYLPWYNMMQKYNFKTTNIYKVLTSLDEIEKYINDFKNQKLLIDYETDGIVIKLNELKYYDMLGQTQKFPHWAIAFKYEPNIAETKIKSIFVTIGRTGLVTYNCSLDPTLISGSIVEYATLNNYNYVKELNLNVNDKVYVKKAGEIIPCIIGLVSYKNKIDVYPHIDKCPYCNSSLYNANNYLEEYCLNRNCPEINKRKLIHFASKDCMNFFSMGEKIIDKFIQLGYLNSVTDFYTLKEYIASLTKLDNFGPKSILKILDSIEKSRENSLESLLFGLSIKHIGQKVATFIASKVLKLSNFLTYNFDLLISYNEIGEKIIGSLKQWVSEQENISIVNKLIDLGLDLEYKSNIKSKTFENISFVITGTLSKPRNYFEQIIKTNNGNIMNAISKKTTYLLCGDDAGSKLKKAKELNIKIISEDEFYNLLKTNESK